ncbi:MAG: TetR/AcrR family transcriptional regulator [Ferruginibacter sp.]
MAATDTKQKILDASLQLFNENGISSVRLQQIADETGISVGNLAYHFNNKEAIAETLITTVISSLQELLRQYGKYPPLPDLDFFFKTFYQLSSQYRFFNFDILEIKRTFPASYELLQPLFNKVKLQLERRFDLCLQQRLLQKDANIKNIAANVWLLLFFMPAEAQLNGKNTITAHQYRRRLWNYLSLYFTAKGSTEYSTEIEPEFTGS